MQILEQIEELFYGKADQQRRFTQDFPVLPDVWLKYAKHEAIRVDLLMTPHCDFDAPTLARALRQRLANEREVDGGKCWAQIHPGLGPPRVLFNQSVVLASLSFWEMVRGAMPLTDWWKRVV